MLKKNMADYATCHVFFLTVLVRNQNNHKEIMVHIFSFILIGSKLTLLSKLMVLLFWVKI